MNRRETSRLVGVAVAAVSTAMGLAHGRVALAAPPAAPSASTPSAPSARLVYQRRAGAEDCPDEAALRAAVVTRLGYDPFDADASSTLFAEITREGATHRATVKLVDGDVVRGARDLEHTGGRCVDLVDGMALTISIAIDPRSLVAPVEAPVPVPEAAVAPPPAPAPLAPPVSAPAPPTAPAPASERPHLVASLAPTIAFGSAPAAAVGLVGGLGLVSRPFSIALEARGELPSSRELSPGVVSTSFLGATVAPCWLPGIVMVCAVGTAGRLAASSRGILVPGDDAALHVLGGARLGVAEPLTSAVDLRATADVLYAFTDQSIRVDAREVYALPRASVVLGLGLGLHFF